MKRWLADRLCRRASWLRGERWYVADAYGGVPGNRVAELRQLIWQEAVTLCHNVEEDQDSLDRINIAVAELAQAAGEAYGFYPPDWWEKEQQRRGLGKPL